MRGAVALLVAIAGLASGCAWRESREEPDVAAVRAFDEHPIYWVGERFEGLELEHADVGRYDYGFVTLIYGTCEPRDPDGIFGPEGGSCSAPLVIQVFPLCPHAGAVADANPIWRRRSVRGSPVGVNDDAPALLASRVWVKVYAHVPSEPDLAFRALRALRSANDVAPVLAPGDPIPPTPRDVLEGRLHACDLL